MRLELAERDLAGPLAPRRLEFADIPEVGALLLAAYRRTVDDEGEDESDAVAEVARTVGSQYGAFQSEASFVVETTVGSSGPR